MPWAESSTGVEEWVPDPQVTQRDIKERAKLEETDDEKRARRFAKSAAMAVKKQDTPDTPPPTQSHVEPSSSADRLQKQRARSAALAAARANEVPAKAKEVPAKSKEVPAKAKEVPAKAEVEEVSATAEVAAAPASAKEVGSCIPPPPLLHRYRTAGGSSYWSLEAPSHDHALIAAQYDASAPGCCAAEPLGCSSSAAGPSPLDELAASVDAEVDALFESLGGRFADEDDRCPYSLSCNDSIALDLDRAHLTYGEITARAMLQAMREGVRATPSDVLLDLGSGRGNAALAAAAGGGVGHVFGLELLPSLVELSQAAAAQVLAEPSRFPLLQAAPLLFVQGDILRTPWWEGLEVRQAGSGDGQSLAGTHVWTAHDAAPRGVAASPEGSGTAAGGGGGGTARLLPTIVYLAATKWKVLMPQLTARLLRLPVGTRIIVTTHPLAPPPLAAASAASSSGDGVHPTAGVEAVEVWSRTLDYQHGPELVRVYELRPYTP